MMPLSKLALTFSMADQSFLQSKSLGILHVSQQLLECLASRPELEQLRVLSNGTLDETLRRSLPSTVILEPHNRVLAARLFRIVWDQWGVYRAARNSNNPWLFLPKGFASFSFRCPVKLAAYVHDAMHDYYRRHYSPNPLGRENWYFQKSLLATIKQSRIIFTNSDFTAAEVVRIAANHGLAPPRLRTIGIGSSRPAEPHPEKRNCLVVPVSRWPHKRSDLARQYLERWQRETDFPGEIHFVGGLPIPHAPANPPRWRWHNRLPSREYRQLLSQARILAFFSEYEGFGMPPVEAMLAGACPVYSDIPATREVMRGVGFAFRNEDYASFAAALGAALNTPEDQIDLWAGQLSSWHDWSRVVETMVSALLTLE